MTNDEMIDRMKSVEGLTSDESKELVRLLDKLDRVKLAMVSGYALGKATMPRYTVIQPELRKGIYD